MRTKLRGNITKTLLKEIEELLLDHKLNNYIVPSKD